MSLEIRVGRLHLHVQKPYYKTKMNDGESLDKESAIGDALGIVAKLVQTERTTLCCYLKYRSWNELRSSFGSLLRVHRGERVMTAVAGVVD